MISKENYNYLKDKYGNVASWTIWELPADTTRVNMGSLKPFDNPDINMLLNTKYVFVGLNGSGLHDAYMEMDKPWFNFHSDYRYGNDYKMRYALINTPYWGSYITDIIKYLPNPDSGKVESYLKRHPEVVEENIKIFEDELSHLDDNVIIIALGNVSYKYLSKYFSGKYDVRKITHYSAAINLDEYRKEILGTLSGSKHKIATTNEKTMITTTRPAHKAKETVVTTVESEWPEYEIIVAGSNYSLRKNTTDTRNKITDLYYYGKTGRKLGFCKRGENLLIFSTKDLYEKLCRITKMPETISYKKQPHFILSRSEFAEVLKLIVKNGL